MKTSKTYNPLHDFYVKSSAKFVILIVFQTEHGTQLVDYSKQHITISHDLDLFFRISLSVFNTINEEFMISDIKNYCKVWGGCGALLLCCNDYSALRADRRVE